MLKEEQVPRTLTALVEKYIFKACKLHEPQAIRLMRILSGNKIAFINHCLYQSQ